MYQQLLYQAANKLNNSLQINKLNSLDVLMLIADIAVIIGGVYIIRQTLKETKQEAELRKYKTS